MGRAARLTLEPLRVDHAPAMVEVLADPALYEFTGGRPPTLDELTARIFPGHGASERVARKVGLLPTTELVDGEVVYTSCVVGAVGRAQKGYDSAPGARHGSSGP